jgi:hypothetical protein
LKERCVVSLPCRSRLLDMNALQLEHAHLGRRSWRGETADPASGRQDPMAGDDQRHRISGHGLADLAQSSRRK